MSSYPSILQLLVIIKTGNPEALLVRYAECLYAGSSVVILYILSVTEGFAMFHHNVLNMMYDFARF